LSTKPTKLAEKKLDKKQAFGGSTGRVLLELLHIKLHMFEYVRRVSLWRYGQGVEEGGITASQRAATYSQAVSRKLLVASY